jgi:hypothetical protein
MSQGPLYPRAGTPSDDLVRKISAPVGAAVGGSVRMGRRASRFLAARRPGMRRVLMLAAVAALVLANSGCLINGYSSNPNRRITELINNSEDLRQIELEWERIWFMDHPSHMTFDRVDGSIQPN